jgi:mortality factor 4-like protein 1
MSDDEDATFVKGEKIFAYFQGLIYEARILNVRFGTIDADNNTQGQLYKVHYLGWKDRWDEEVARSRILKHNDKNRLRARRLRLKVEKNSGTKVVATGPPDERQQIESRNHTSSSSSSRRRRATSSNSSSSSSASSSAAAVYNDAVRVEMPFGLKRRLVHEWRAINDDQCLVSVPAQQTVAAIVDDYLKTKMVPVPSSSSSSSRKRQRADAEQEFHVDPNCKEIMHGFRLYFDRALGTALLYHFERQQLAQLLNDHPDVPHSQLYGAEHFLRLLVKLPELMPSSYDANVATPIVAVATDFLNWLDRSAPLYFSTKHFVPAPPSYIRMSTPHA